MIVLGKVSLPPGVRAQTVTVCPATKARLTAVTDTPGVIVETVVDADGNTTEIRARRLDPNASDELVATFTLVEIYP